MYYEDHRLKRITRFLYKWLWCSWIHKSDRCYNMVIIKDNPYWHCGKCHSCSKESNLMIEKRIMGWF